MKKYLTKRLLKKFRFNKFKLSKYEKEIEDASLRGEYVPVSPEEFQEVVKALQQRRKDAVLSVRISSHDLNRLKEKARKLGLKYQTFITELLHRAAE